MKLLLIEDDERLSSNLKSLLLKEHFAVDVAQSKSAALQALDINQYDCLILDLGLPDGSGYQVLKHVRTIPNHVPVIIITARGQVDDRIRGLNLGADDYLPKPVDSYELVARIRALIRRHTQHTNPEITIGDLTISPPKHQARVNLHLLKLTAKEFAVLEYLAFHEGQVVTRTMLMDHIWGSDFETFSNVVDVYIRNLRRKLEKYSRSSLIKTIRGKGYILGQYETEHFA